MNFRRAAPAAFAATAACLMLLPAALSAQSDDRRRAVGDWLVEESYDGEGSRILRMTRESGDYRLDYHLNLGAGVEGQASQGFLVWRLNCGQGAEESLAEGVAGTVDGAAVRRRLADYLARCETPAGEASDLLRDFDRGFALLGEWRAEAEADWSAAENAADAAEAAADSMELNMSDDMGVADMNYSAEEAPDAAAASENSTVEEPDPPK